jgi:CDP-diacylglycerol--serine O-phosphatidyltransferase
LNRIPVIPTLLTLGNGVCGFAAIAYASKINLDGSMAESSVDFYFLLSAALILQAWESQPIVAKTVAIIAGLYLACAVLRLARFNTENTPDPASHKRFKGLPSPAAAGCVASLAILRADLSLGLSGLDPNVLQGFVRIWAPLGSLVVALLMVSHFSYPHFGRQLLRGRKQFQFIVQLVLVLAIVALTPQLAFFLIFWAYALIGPVRSVTLQLRRPSVPEHTPHLH